MTSNFMRSMKFVETLNTLGIDYALIGGMAICVWSEERFTKDIDFTIALDRHKWPALKRFLSTSSSTTLDLIATDDDATLPHLIRIHFEEESIDLITALTEFQKSLLSRKIQTNYFGKPIFIASAEDLIISKLIAKRGQDLVDIEKVLARIKNLDIPYIEKWAKEWDALKLWQDISIKQ